MPKWIDLWVVILGLAAIAMVAAGAIWHHVFVGLGSGLAWAAMGHAFLKSRR